MWLCKRDDETARDYFCDKKSFSVFLQNKALRSVCLARKGQVYQMKAVLVYHAAFSTTLLKILWHAIKRGKTHLVII